MANNPQINQGVLNRLRASVQFNDHPELNITAAFLGREGISLGFEGGATTTLPQMIGTVQSPEPYQLVTITAHLLKTQSLVTLFKSQVETDSRIGDCTVRADAQGLVYPLNNCALIGAPSRELDFSGRDAGWVVTITGAYVLNAALYNF